MPRRPIREIESPKKPPPEGDGETAATDQLDTGPPENHVSTSNANEAPPRRRRRNRHRAHTNAENEDPARLSRDSAPAPAHDANDAPRRNRDAPPRKKKKKKRRRENVESPDKSSRRARSSNASKEPKRPKEVPAQGSVPGENEAMLLNPFRPVRADLSQPSENCIYPSDISEADRKLLSETLDSYNLSPLIQPLIQIGQRFLSINDLDDETLCRLSPTQRTALTLMNAASKAVFVGPLAAEGSPNLASCVSEAIAETLQHFGCTDLSFLTEGLDIELETDTDTDDDDDVPSTSHSARAWLEHTLSDPETTPVVGFFQDAIDREAARQAEESAQRRAAGDGDDTFDLDDSDLDSD